jgi:hypothetical protein
METIFKLFDQTRDPNYIGQDKTAREILDISSKPNKLI